MESILDRKICPFPFSRMELGLTHGEFVPCCYTWFKDEYHQDFKKSLNKGISYEDLWNSQQAIELRKSILDGSYKYCLTQRCNKPQITVREALAMDQNYFETPISEENIKAMQEGKGELPSGPSSLSISGDLKCNLKCPTCRDGYITTSTSEDQEIIDRELEFISKNKEHIRVIKMSNGGEVFFSKDQRRLLKSLNNYDFPKLSHLFVISNALLANEKNFADLFPGSSFIKKMAISIDAGNEETYKQTRGGNWKTLLRNLEWLGKQRAQEKLLTLNYNFVVRKVNYRSIPEFIDLGRKNNVDYFEFIKYDDWQDLYNSKLSLSKRYHEEAVHDRNHPEHFELIKILADYKNDSDIRINIDGLFN